jgi:hypothetical protein
MIRAVANTDCRFSALLQNTSAGSFTAGGFGYNFTDGATEPVPVEFDEDSAAKDPSISFRYEETPNCTAGQLAIPYDVPTQVQNALDKATGNAQGNGTGIIEHPFNADYSYPAYDYDYWILASGAPAYEWQAGWNQAYWSFYNKKQPTGPFTAASDGIATHVLNNGYVDGFVFNTQPALWPPVFDMTGTYNSRPCDCGCSANSKGK